MQMEVTAEYIYHCNNKSCKFKYDFQDSDQVFSA